MFQLSKKVISITIGAVILVWVWVGSAFYITDNEWEFHHSKNRYSSQENENIFENTSKKVTSTESGAVISITFGNSGTLSEAHALFEIMKWSSEYKNSAFILNSTIQSDILNIFVSSDIPDLIKYIQKELTTSADNDNNEKWFGIEFLVWNTDKEEKQNEAMHHERD